jgi:hypothetical protein
VRFCIKGLDLMMTKEKGAVGQAAAGCVFNRHSCF